MSLPAASSTALPNYDSRINYLPALRLLNGRRKGKSTLPARIKNALVIGAAYGVIFFLLVFQLSKDAQRSLTFSLLSFLMYAALAFLISSRK